MNWNRDVTTSFFRSSRKGFPPTFAQRVVAVTGDGGFLMNSQKLETAIRMEMAFVVAWVKKGSASTD